MSVEKDSGAVLAVAGWSEDLRVGVDAIDLQHRRLFDLVETLRDVVERLPGAPAFACVIDELEHYTNAHFRDEEALMAASGYPGRRLHEAAHGEFRRLVVKARTACQVDDGGAEAMLAYLSEWLVRHIRNEDQVAADFYLERNPPVGWFARVIGRPG
jgi:hemerythrin-like metal-binding protein